MDLTAILESARTKSSGIITADRYFRSIEQCFDGFCPIKAFDLASADEWVEQLKQGESKLVYSDNEMLVGKDFGHPGMAASTAGAVLDFDAVITSTRKDRDGDILETAGADLDLSAPLLWQHIPMQPIGKLVSKGTHTKNMLSGRFAIADTELGRDAAVLTEFGALRISHGFEPLEFEPLKGKDGGWHIIKFAIREVSLVSIPSNVDAVVTAFSRGKLHSPLIKGWAQKHYESRPVQGKGFGDNRKTTAARWAEWSSSGGQVGDDGFYGLLVDQEVEMYRSIGEQVTQEDFDWLCNRRGFPDKFREMLRGAVIQMGLGDELKSGCSCNKSVSDYTAEPKKEKGYGLPGSYENLSSELHETLRGHLRDNGMELDDDQYAYVSGTFEGYAVVCVSTEDGSEHYKLAWEMDGDKPVWSGEPKKVNVETNVTITDAEGETEESEEAPEDSPKAAAKPQAKSVSVKEWAEKYELNQLLDLLS